MKKQFITILLCLLLTFAGRLWLAPVVRDMQLADYDYANRHNFAERYPLFEPCAAVREGDYFYYTAWCASSPENKPMQVLRVYRQRQCIGGDVTYGHFREGEDLKVYRLDNQYNQYIVFGHNPAGQYSQYQLDFINYSQVVEQYQVDISDKEYILDVYFPDGQYYIPALNYN